MNILSIEKARTELLSFLENTSSRRLKAKRISEFFALLIEQKSYPLIESYLLEFMLKYLDYLKTFSPIGVNPAFTESIIRINTKLIEVIESAEYEEKLGQINLEIENKLLFLNKVLAGKQIGLAEERKAFFPLIEDEECKSITQTIGAIDSITIKLSKAKQKDKFIIVTSETESDKLLEVQINICWEKAKEFCKKHVRKISVYHEVIISFDRNLGVYRGESLGVALTIAMIEELLRYYNTPTLLEPIINVAFTGGLNENGDIKPVKKEIIEKKAEIVFYSNCEVFAVPKEDESHAVEKIEELKQKYLNRKIETVGVKTLNEILLRRDLVEIKKQKLIIRTGKFVKKNLVSAIVTVLLAVLFGYLFVMDWDDNPAYIENDGDVILVKNKNGKLLWTKKLKFSLSPTATIFEKRSLQKLVDIDDDAVNEVILSHERFKEVQYDSMNGLISCYNKKGHLLWRHIFNDTVYTKSEGFKRSFSTTLVDTITQNSIKQILCLSRNDPYFPSAVYRLALKDGKRLDGTLWNVGHIVDGIVEDFNYDGKKELAITFFNNSYRRTGIAVIDLDKVDGMLPGTESYKLLDKKDAEPTAYILIPNSDYNKALNFSMNTPLDGSLNFYQRNKAISWLVTEGESFITGLGYLLSYNLKDFEIVIGNNFASRRDTLVLRGLLPYPLTDTKEYRELLKSQIIYWHNGKWVKREELE